MQLLYFEASEIDKQVEVLLFPSGDIQFRHVREQALAYWLEHANEAHPRLLELIDVDSPPVLLITILPQFGRVESVAVLEKVLHNSSDPLTVAAGQALGRHPLPEAGMALEHALNAARD